MQAERGAFACMLFVCGLTLPRPGGWAPSAPTHPASSRFRYPMVNSWVWGFRWPSFCAPATAVSWRSQMRRPRVMSDS